MKICFVNYATDKVEGHRADEGKDFWKNRGILQREQALQHGADEVRGWDEEMLHDTWLYQLHRETFQEKYVAGFIWKPYIILKSLIETDCEALLYLDADLNIVDDISKLTNHLYEQDVVIPYSPWLHGQFMKREAAILLKSDTPEYYNLQSLFGNVMAFRNTPLSRKFLLDWLILAVYPNMSSYQKSRFIKEHPNWHAHRNQGGLTVLYHRYGFKQYSDELIDITDLRAQGGATLIGYTVEKR